MPEEVKDEVSIQGDPVTRMLELQSKYGIDQQTMLIYLSSMNLMSILNLIGHRYGASASISLPVPQALPAQTPAGGVPGEGLSLDNMINILSKILGGQTGAQSSAQSAGGPGINPATIVSMLNALRGMNIDFGSLASMLSGLLGAGAKPGPDAPAGTQSPVPAVATPGPAQLKDGENKAVAAGEEKSVKREVPKIMKWDHLDDRKKA